MITRKLFRYCTIVCNYGNKPLLNNYIKNVKTFASYSDKSRNDKNEPKALVFKDSFENIENKTRNTYLEMIKIFINRDHIYRRGHVEFIYSAMKNMDSFGVNKDLEVYKALVDVLPKGKFLPQNIFQAEFMHYPKQQQCVIDLLEQMEDNGVIPDLEMEDQLMNIFGKRGYPLRKLWRMRYWMPKFKNLSPWPVPDPLPRDIFDLAKYAIERISSADYSSVVTVYHSIDIPDAIDDTWIISAQSETQKLLLNQYDAEKPVYVEGPFKVWIKGNPINYFLLRGEPKPFVDEDIDMDDVTNIKVSSLGLNPPVAKRIKVIPSVHEQEDGIIFAVCATGTSSKDSLLSWIRHLEKDGNEKLEKLPIVFTLKSGVKEVAKTDEKEEESARKIEDK